MTASICRGMLSYRDKRYSGVISLQTFWHTFLISKNTQKSCSVNKILIIPIRKCQKLMRSENYIYRGSIWAQSQLCQTICLEVIAILTAVGTTMKMLFGHFCTFSNLQLFFHLLVISKRIKISKRGLWH